MTAATTRGRDDATPDTPAGPRMAVRERPDPGAADPVPDHAAVVRVATRVLLVDDHRVFSEALAGAVDHHPDFECVGTPTTIEECLAAVAETSPDVVLLDIYLPDGDGIDAIPRIRDLCPSARVVIMTGYTDVAVMARAASAGAAGFLPKESTIGTVLDSIRAVRDGAMLVDGSTLAAILGRVDRIPPGTRAGEQDAVRLTPRERDVLDLMGQGLDPHAVAEQLGISLHTCRGYEKSILAKLDAHSQLEAVVVAARRGLIARLGR